MLSKLYQSLWDYGRCEVKHRSIVVHAKSYPRSFSWLPIKKRRVQNITGFIVQEKQAWLLRMPLKDGCEASCALRSYSDS